MSTWQGTGAPSALVDGVKTDFPHVDQGGREEAWEPEVDESWVNGLGEVITGDRKFRFVGTYTWSSLTDDQVRLLVRWYNQRQTFQWRIHSDVTVGDVTCRLTAVETAPGAVESAQSVVTVTVEAVALVESIPVPSLLVTGAAWPKMGVAA